MELELAAAVSPGGTDAKLTVASGVGVGFSVGFGAGFGVGFGVGARMV